MSRYLSQPDVTPYRSICYPLRPWKALPPAGQRLDAVSPVDLYSDFFVAPSFGAETLGVEALGMETVEIEPLETESEANA